MKKWLLGLVLTPGLALAQAELVEPDANGIIPQPHIALTNTHVVDVRTGTVLENAVVVVVVRDARIVSVGPDPAPANAIVMDLEGKYLLPGFMDAHWDGRTLENLRRAVESGVTTMKSASVGKLYRRTLSTGPVARR